MKNPNQKLMVSFIEIRKPVLHFDPKQNAVNRTENLDSSFKVKDILILLKYAITGLIKLGM